MRPILLLFVFSVLWNISSFAQNCPQYATLMDNARVFWKNGDYDKALKQLTAAREHCPGKGAEIDAQFIAFTKQIADKYKEAEKQTQRANREADANRSAALRAYANDLAYKSEIALRDSLRTEAFRLAEFAHRYVDSDNLNVTRALANALYYNDNPDHKPLNWCYLLEGDNSGVIDFAFSPDGTRLATGSYDNTVKIWDLHSGKAILTIANFTEKVTHVAFSPACPDDPKGGNRLAAISDDLTVKIWDSNTGKLMLNLEGLPSIAETIAFSPDGKKLVITYDNHSAKIWDLTDQKVILSLNNPEIEAIPAFTHDGKIVPEGRHVFHPAIIWNADFSSDSKNLIWWTEGKQAEKWDLETGKVTQISDAEIHSDSIRNVFSGPEIDRYDAEILNNDVKIWDNHSGKQALLLNGHQNTIMSIAFSPDGKRLATGSADHRAIIWNSISGQEEHLLIGHNGYVFSVAFSPACPGDPKGGKWLATASSDETVKIWGSDSGNVSINLHCNSYAYCLAFSPDGKTLATGCSDQTTLIWDLKTGKVIRKLLGHNGPVKSVAFSPDGKRLATGSTDYKIKIWDVNSGDAIFTLEGHKDRILSVAFSPACATDPRGGSMLASSASDGFAKIWDLRTGKAILTLEGNVGEITGIAFSPEGKTLATVNRQNDDKTSVAKVWDLQSGKLAFALEGDITPMGCVAFSSDGKRLATGFRQPIIWDLDPDVMIDKLHRERPLATLTQPDLDVYDLENLLSLKPENETQLCRTNEIWQIAAFAGLADQSTRNSQDLKRTAADYARAARLYRYALKQSGDSSLLKRLGELYLRQATDILASARPDTALQYARLAYQLLPDDPRALHALALSRLFAPSGMGMGAEQDPAVVRSAADYFFTQSKWREAGNLYEKAEAMEHQAENLKRLFEIAGNTGQKFDFQRFIKSNDTTELRDYALFLVEQGIPDEAVPLYEKSERIKHLPETLLSLYKLADSTKQRIYIQQFLRSNQPEELRQYADYLYEQAQWPDAMALYEKAEQLGHQPEALMHLHRISELTKQPFDFQRFLNSNNASELKGYADYLSRSGIWDIARQLYEKAERLEHNTQNLIALCEISDSSGQVFDIQRLLSSKDPEELKAYAEYFAFKARRDDPRENLAPLRLCLRMSDRLLEVQKKPENDTLVSVYCNNLAWNLLVSGTATEAEQVARHGIALNPANRYLITNLPHTLLLQGKTAEAISEYLKWADKPYNEYRFNTYRDAFLADFEEFEAAGLVIPGLEEVKKTLETK